MSIVIPRFLGRQPVGIDSGQRPNEGRFAVVDVSGGAEHQVASGVVHDIIMRVVVSVRGFCCRFR